MESLRDFSTYCENMGTTRPADINALEQLSYFTEWRQRLWMPAVRWLLGDPSRFQGKSVLEIGCRSGRMSCLFGLLGARVLGVDLPSISLQSAREEARRLRVGELVRFLNYPGTPDTLPEGDFDFIFTKSVLVIIPDLGRYLTALARKMTPAGEMMVAENLAGGRLLNLVRGLLIHRQEFLKRFHGVDEAFLATFQRVYDIIEQRQYYGLVTAIRARRCLRVCPAVA